MRRPGRWPILCAFSLLSIGDAVTAIQATADNQVSLLNSLRSPDVTTIIVTGDVTLDAASWTPQDSVLLTDGRKVLLTATGNPNFTSVDAPLFAGSAVVNFSSLWPVVTIGSGATLQIDNLQLYGIKSIYGPDITQRHGLLRVRGSATWPTVDAQPGAELILNNTLIQVFSPTCTPEAVKQRAAALWPAVGSEAVEVTAWNPLAYVIRGIQHLPLPVVPVSGTGPSSGNVDLVNYGVTTLCQQDTRFNPDGTAAPPSSSGSSGGKAPWWVWLIVGIAAAIAVTAGALMVRCWLIPRRRRRRLQAQLQHRKPAPKPGELPLQDIKMEDKDSPHESTFSQPHTPPQTTALTSSGSPATQLPGLSSTLRVRFGDLDQSLELGELIGKGGYGRVYRARWKGAPAAVKVVEHSTPSAAGISGSPPSSGLNLESLLGTSLSHPNIVATYRVSTVQLRRSSGIEQPTSFFDASLRSLTSAELGKAAGVGTGDLAPGTPSVGGAAGVSPAAASSGTDVVGGTGGRSSSGGAGGSPVALQSRRQSGALFETWMVLELCDRGSLAEAIKARRFLSRKSGQPHMRAVLMCLLDVARGLQYLHANNVVHGDMKPGNVLLKSRDDGSKGFMCKIADLGLSRLLDPQQSQRLTRSCGTIGYMPPEVLTAGRLTTACDVYSFGILMWELATCQFAFLNETAAQVFYRVVQLGERPTAPQGIEFPQGYLVLMQRCWDADHNARPAFLDVVRDIQTLLDSECK